MMVSDINVRRLLAPFPLYPLLFGVILGVILGDTLGTSFWLTGALIGLFFALVTKKLPVTLFAIGTMLGHGSHGWIIQNQHLWVDATLVKNQEVSHPQLTKLTGIIIDTGTHDWGPYLLKVTQVDAPLNGIPLPTNVKVVLQPQRGDLKKWNYGDRVKTDGFLKPIPPLRNPYGFNQAQWRHRQGADLIFSSQQAIEGMGHSSARVPLLTMINWRDVLRKNMTSGLDPDSEEAQLIRAVVLGERPPRASKMTDDFRYSGTLHVFAVSGLHVGMVGSILAMFFWLTRAPRWLIITLTILGMALYAGITGMRPPAVRAVIMASVFLSGFLLQRRPTLINSLAASAIIVLLWDGHQLFTPGFQLSYGVLLAIALLTRFWLKIFQPIATLDPFLPRLLLTPWQERRLGLKEKLQSSLSVSSAAWMGSTPLLWTHFGIATPIAILAGIPLMLLVFVLLGLAMLSVAIAPLSPAVNRTINQLNALVARTTHNTAASFANLPFSHFTRHPTRPKNGSIIVFDIPKGGAANLIDIGGGALLDSGRGDSFRYNVLPTLTHFQIQPESLIISHADSKHSGAMSECLSLYHPKQALIPRPDLRSPSYKLFLTKAKASGCRLITPQLKQTFPLSSSDPTSYLEILHAPAHLDGNGLADDTGLLIRLHWHGWRILFTGDAGLSTESRMLESGINIQADVIIMGRNADDITGHQAFYDAVAPQVIISTNCRFPERERISDSWRNQRTHQNIHLLDQEITGAVTITLDLKNNELTLTPTLPAEAPVTLKQRSHKTSIKTQPPPTGRKRE